jgi:hypothetical protein
MLSFEYFLSFEIKLDLKNWVWKEKLVRWVVQTWDKEAPLIVVWVFVDLDF